MKRNKTAYIIKVRDLIKIKESIYILPPFTHSDRLRYRRTPCTRQGTTGIRKVMMEKGRKMETGREGLMVGMVKSEKERWRIVGV